MIKGLGIVISIFIITLLVSIPLGLIIALLRRSKYKLIKFKIKKWGKKEKEENRAFNWRLA